MLRKKIIFIYAYSFAVPAIEDKRQAGRACIFGPLPEWQRGHG